MIVHIGIPFFYAAMEELRRPELKKRPFVLAEPGARSIVQAVNRFAGKEGITEGMPLCRARRLCRRIQVLPSDYYYYRERNRDIVRDFGRFSPLVEGTHPGSYFIDITGTRRLWGPEPDIACRMEKELVLLEEVHAPVEEGQKLGYLRITLDGEEIGRVDAVAAEAVPASNFTNALRSILTWWLFG